MRSLIRVGRARAGDGRSERPPLARHRVERQASEEKRMDREGGHGALSGASWCGCPALARSIDGHRPSLGAASSASSTSSCSSSRHRAEVAPLVERTATLPGLLLAVAEHQHVGRPGELGVADLLADRLRALVDPRADAGLAQLAGRPRPAHSLWRSATGRTTACTGASQSGKRPAWCSIRMPAKRSIEPSRARWIITGGARRCPRPCRRGRSAPASGSRAGRCRTARSGRGRR